MDLIDLLVKSGAGKSVSQLAGAIGLGESQAGDLIGALAPAMMRGIQKQTESGSSLAGLEKALAGGNHQRYIEQPDLMQSESTREDGNKILGHIFGSKDVSRNVAAQAAEQTGIDTSIIKKALPLLAGLAMAALSKKTGGSTRTSAPTESGLGGLLGSLLVANSNKQGGLDDLLGLAKKLF